MEHLSDPTARSPLFQIGGGNNDQTPTQIIEIPDLLSILATNHVDGEVQGINNLQAQYVKEYGPGNYIPNVFIQYWGMRVMAYLAALIALFALWGLWLIRRKTLAKAKWFLFIAPWFVITPFLMNTAGWLLTESGRQPWIVQGLMKTSQAASPSVTATDIWISLTVFVLLYLALGVADVYLMIHYGRKELCRATATGRTAADGGGRRRRTDGGADADGAPSEESEATAGSRPSSTRRRQWSISTTSGSSSSPSSGSGSSSSRDSTSGWGCCTPSSAVTSRNGGSPSTRSGPSGTATRCGWSWRGPAIFAAFPSWYATMFSTFYLALVVVLVALIVRGLSFEFNRKIDDPRWRSTWRWSLTIGSFLIPLLLGTALGDLLHGLPID